MDEQKRDGLSFLLENGMSSETIKRYLDQGISMDELVSSCSKILERGGSIADPDMEDIVNPFGIFDPFGPPNTSNLPNFPLDSLPPVLKDMAAATAESLQVDPGMTAAAALAVAGLSVQGRFIINPKPGWVEPLNSYIVTIARPSERKTPALEVMSRPIYSFEKEENKRRKPLIDEYMMRRDVMRKQLANMKEAAAKPTSKNPVSLDDIARVQDGLSALESNAVTPLRLLADDTTPEALVSLMAANGGRMGLVSDEGGIFDTIAGKYSNGRVNLDVFLKSYSGSPLRVDRKGREQETIEHPTLTMLLMVQPVVLEAIMNNREFEGRGFLSRPLYSLPKSLVGKRRYRTQPVPKEIEEDYTAAIYALLSVDGEAQTIRLSPEADQEAERFFNHLEQRLADDFSEDLESWAGKFHGQVMRLCGVLHCCQYFQEAAQVPVSLETMQAAQTIGEYFLEHTKAAFQIIGLAERQEVKDAKYILKKLLAGGRQQLSKRDLFRQCDGRIRTVEDMEPGLKVLVDRGYIYIDRISTGGRPTEKIILNPGAK